MIKGNYILIALLVVLCAISILFIIEKPVVLSIVNGASMEPTLSDKEILMLYKRKPQRGDIILFSPPKSWDKQNQIFIKRIIAVPGDRVIIDKNNVYVNNKLEIVMPSSYSNTPYFSFDIEKGYFVMGDNYGNSYDSYARAIQGKDYIIEKESVEYSVKGVN